MEFGKVELEDLDVINFNLPPDREETRRILSKQISTNKTEIYVGCAKWGRKDWIGKIYPKGTKEADFLKLYGEHFNSIELNASFYRMPSRAQAAEWSAKVPSEFLFCPKFSDKISHIKRLKDTAELNARFLDGISGFGKNLGPALLMPHPGMSFKHIDTIDAYLSTIPKEIKVFVELRNIEWYSNPEAFARISDVFERHNTGFIMTDSAGRRDCVHMRLTTPQAFIRFQGYGLHPTDYSRVDEWVQRIKKWMGEGIEKVFFFMHQEDERNSPELAKYVIEQLNKHCATALKIPQFVSADETEASPKDKKVSVKRASRSKK